jgi:hypothetical protein
MAQWSWSANYATLSYSRGTLLLTALEDRVGKVKMIEVLREFIRANERKLGSWDAVVAAVATVAGKPHADWLRAWLHRPGAPDLRLQNVRVDHGVLKADLVQTSDPPFIGAVDVALVSGDRRLASHRIEFAAATTAIELPMPLGAQTLILDPDYRLPRKFDPQRSDEVNQRTWSVVERAAPRTSE